MRITFYSTDNFTLSLAIMRVHRMRSELLSTTRKVSDVLINKSVVADVLKITNMIQEANFDDQTRTK